MPREARLEGYSRRHRFTQRGAFGPVIRGTRKVRGLVAVLHVAAGTAGISRFGVALTRRVIPQAVDRNRVKRAAREIFRRHAVKSAGLDLVLMLRSRLDAAGEAALPAEIDDLFQQAMRRSARSEQPRA